MWRSALLVIFLVTTKTKAMRTYSEEDTHSHLYLETSPYRPTTMNFDDIFAKSLTTLLLADQTSSSSTTEENFHLTIPTQYIDNPKTHTSPLIVHMASPAPTPRKSRRRKTTTEEYVEEVKPTVIATSTSTQTTQQRGVLDLLFPAARVKTFKSFFDGFRRILSHTFK